MVFNKQLRRGEMRGFPGAESIARRIVHREDLGVDAGGRKFEAALAYNPSGHDVWLVALIFADGELWARAPFGRAVRLERTDKAAKAWKRAIGYQLRNMLGGEKVLWKPKDEVAVMEALDRIWPKRAASMGS